jgi:phenylpropionate dioxygenase-like ring-hydroxylating dioxygenase large terminal subunit
VGRYPFPAYPNGWFRLAYGSDLDVGEVKPLEYFGRSLVLFRGEDGQATVMDAHCPHLGAHLGVGGSVEGSAIRCPFHAWLWDRDGSCTEIPYAKRIPPAAKIRTWPVAERDGLILVFHHQEGEAPGYEIPELPQLESEEWCDPIVRHWTVRARWLDMNENCVDQAHFRYVHGTLDIPKTTAEVDGHVLTTVSNIRQKAPGGEAEGCLVTKDYGPGFQTVELTGIIDSLLMNTSTPIDEETTDVSFAYTVKTEGDPGKARLAEAVVKDLVQQFENDRPIWENKAYWSEPRLCDGDGPFAVYRKWMQQFF